VPVAEVGRDERRLRYERRLETRTHLAKALEADVTLWMRLPSHRLPGAQGRLLVSGPDAFRLRIESLFGTALDLFARGDTVLAYAPGSRVAWTTSSAGDSIGIADPGRIACRVWSAGFDPPDEAWSGATFRDSLLELGWPEGGGEVRVAIGSDGLPREAAYVSEEALLRARYVTWHHERGGSWPSQIRLEEERRGVVTECRLTAFRFPAAIAKDRLVPRVGRDVRYVSRAEIVEWFEGAEER
jgi:hypothetical protein